MRTLTKETTDCKQQRIVCLFLPGSGIRLYASQLSCQQSTEVQALAGRPRVAKVSAAANALETGTAVCRRLKCHSAPSPTGPSGHAGQQGYEADLRKLRKLLQKPEFLQEFTQQRTTFGCSNDSSRPRRSGQCNGCCGSKLSQVLLINVTT